MARIRTIKPDFWEDETVATLSPMARLLFIGSWNLADDEGLLRWTPDYLNASLFMYDNLTAPKVKKLMDEIEAMDRVFVYSAGKARQTLAYVVNFRKHQRINRPQPSRLPPPSLQNPATLMMYARRDDWTCHLCKGPLNDALAPKYDGYDNDRLAYVLETFGDWRHNMSPDHLVPRSKGGSDYPSNIGASHVSCNKGRGARPRPYDVPDSLNDSVNEDVNDSPPEGNGGGREVEGKGTPTQVSSSLDRAAPPSADDDENLARTAAQACSLIADRRIDASTVPIANRRAYRSTVLRDVEAEHGPELRRLAGEGLAADAVADAVEPVLMSPTPAPYRDPAEGEFVEETDEAGNLLAARWVPRSGGA